MLPLLRVPRPAWNDPTLPPQFQIPPEAREWMLVSKLADDPAVRCSQSRHSIVHMLRAGLLSSDPLIAKIFASIVSHNGNVRLIDRKGYLRLLDSDYRGDRRGERG